MHAHIINKNFRQASRYQKVKEFKCFQSTRPVCIKDVVNLNGSLSSGLVC